MTGHGIGEKAVFLFRPRADVVYDERRSVRRLPVAHDHDVRKPSADFDSHKVARLVVGRSLGCLETPALSFKVALKVGYAAVVDVGVGLLEPPVLRILREAAFHVLMDKFLKIDLPRVAQRANDHVRANARRAWHVTARIAEFSICRIVAHRHANLFARRRDDVDVVRPRLRHQRDHRREKRRHHHFLHRRFPFIDNWYWYWQHFRILTAVALAKVVGNISRRFVQMVSWVAPFDKSILSEYHLSPMGTIPQTITPDYYYLT